MQLAEKALGTLRVQTAGGQRGWNPLCGSFPAHRSSAAGALPDHQRAGERLLNQWVPPLRFPSGKQCCVKGKGLLLSSCCSRCVSGSGGAGAPEPCSSPAAGCARALPCPVPRAAALHCCLTRPVGFAQLR